MNFGEVAADIDGLANVLGRKATQSDVELVTWTLGMLGRSFSSSDLVAAMRQWDRASRVMGRFFEKFDAYLTPSIAFPPPKIGELKPKPFEIAALKVVNTLGLGGALKASGLVDQMAEKNFEKVPFTQLANMCGLPAMSVPLHWTPDDFPIGVQFVAPFGDEATLFRLAGQLEKARPWFDRRPKI
jgi:amidase